MRPWRPIYLRGEGVLDRGNGPVAHARYELWLILPVQHSRELHPQWSGVVVVTTREGRWFPLDWQWLHLADDHYRLAVRLDGLGPRYLVAGLTSLEPRPDE